jgi:hypothetical protein
MAERCPKSARRKPGGALKYCPEIVEQICTRMANGELLGSICRDLEIDRATVWRWQQIYPEFATAYTQARELMADSYAESVVRISDDSSGDFIEGADGKRRPDWENVQRSRLRADNRKWFAARLSPRYREKAGVEISTPPDRPMQIASIPMTPQEVAKYVRNLLTQAEIVLGLPADEACTSEPDRLKRIINANEPLPVDLYNALVEAPIDGARN